MPIFRPFLLILLAYLSGSIPVAYLAAKMTNSIDIRHYGSGTVSGSMVYEHVSRWLVGSRDSGYCHSSRDRAQLASLSRI